MCIEVWLWPGFSEKFHVLSAWLSLATTKSGTWNHMAPRCKADQCPWSLQGYKMPWEFEDFKYPSNMAPPLQVLGMGLG